MIDPNRQPIQTVLLDVDGTLLDTRNYILSAFAHAAQTFGIRLPSSGILTRQIGRPLETVYGEWAPQSMIAELIESHRQFQEDNLGLVKPYPGSEQALTVLRARGLALAVVTSRSRRTSRASLEIAGIGQFFEFVVSAEDASALKPDPAPLLAALSMLGRSSAGAVMVGDTVHDVHAGQAIGIPTIAALYGFGGEGVRRADPSTTISSVLHLPAAIDSLNA